MDVLADGAWERIFTEKPEVFTREAKREWLDQLTDVTLGSDAFFPFSDNIERAHKSGVKYIAQPGGSVRDEDVIATCDKYGMAMAFTGIRLFIIKKRRCNMILETNSPQETFSAGRQLGEKAFPGR